MSFDLYGINGDLELGANGDVRRVTDSDKLAQDVLKLLNTTLGSDPFYPGYGSVITATSLGMPNDNPESLVSRAQIVLTEVLQLLVNTQEAQSTYQSLTDAETIVDFDTPIVEVDPAEPRQINILVNALSRALTPLSIAFVIRF